MSRGVSLTYSSLTLGSLTLGSLILGACAPNNARELRELRPTSVGYLGAAHRPNPDFDVSVQSSLTRESEVGSFTKFNNDEDDDYDHFKVKSGVALDLAYHRYPMADSAFFYGASLGYKQGGFEFDERTTAYTDANKQTTRVSFDTKSTWLGLPLGWGWIWNSGITYYLDFGPRLRLSHSRTYDDKGEDAAVNVERRDDFVETLDDQTWSFGGLGLLGYSF